MEKGRTNQRYIGLYIGQTGSQNVRMYTQADGGGQLGGHRRHGTGHEQRLQDVLSEGKREHRHPRRPEERGPA